MSKRKHKNKEGIVAWRRSLIRRQIITLINPVYKCITDLLNCGTDLLNCGADLLNKEEFVVQKEKPNYYVTFDTP